MFTFFSSGYLNNCKYFLHFSNPLVKFYEIELPLGLRLDYLLANLSNLGVVSGCTSGILFINPFTRFPQ